MRLIGRRDLARGLGAGAALLSPLVRGLAAEAAGAPTNRRRLFVLTAGNGWGHQGQPRDAMSVGGNLNTTVRSETDWDLPVALDVLAPLKSKVAIVGNFFNPHGVNLHGNGSATLCVMPTVGQNLRVGGISIDRFIGSKAYPGDTYASTVFGLSVFGNLSSPAVCTSADGAEMPVQAPNTPVRAFAKYLGDLAPSAALPGVDPKVGSAQDRSVLDAMVQDIQRLRGRLVGAERRKLDQLLDSTRGIEKQIMSRETLAAATSKMGATPPTLDKSGLNDQAIQEMVDVAFQTLAFGLTHVAHVSVLGRDAYNDAWGGLGLPYDTHLGISHGGVKNPPAGFTFTGAEEKIIRFHASLIAQLFDRLRQVPEDGGTMADSTLAIWVNSGGGKHHDGNATIPLVFVGDAKGQFPGAGRYVRVSGSRCISDAFVTTARAIGVDTTTFGDPTKCKGPIF